VRVLRVVVSRRCPLLRHPEGRPEWKKPRYTIEQHIELGAKLAEFQDILTTETTKLLNAYSLREKAPRALAEVRDSLMRARSRLDDLVCGENPQADYSITRVYYPPRDRRGRS